jgi:hypothetical protein
MVDALLTNCHIKAVFGGLPFQSARLMAEELAIVDPRKIKVAIYQTKFWPRYSRDTVYTRGTNHTHSSAAGHQSTSGQVSGSGSSDSFQAGDWFGNGISTTGTSTNFASSDSAGESQVDSDSEGDSKSEADIPIFVPVPFKELSSVQYYSPEEQLIEFAQALKHQFQRHCFVKIHQRETQPMLVPFVEDFHTPPHNIRWYAERLMKRQHALPAAEIDKLLEEQDEALLEAANKSGVPEDFHE